MVFFMYGHVMVQMVNSIGIAKGYVHRVNGALTLKKGGKISDHSYHAPDHDEVRAEEIKL